MKFYGATKRNEMMSFTGNEVETISVKKGRLGKTDITLSHLVCSVLVSFCQLYTNYSHLGRRTLNRGGASIRCACL